MRKNRRLVLFLTKVLIMYAFMLIVILFNFSTLDYAISSDNVTSSKVSEANKNTSNSQKSEKEKIISYNDLKESNWAYDAIMEMTDKGILTGFPDGRFGVNEPMSREAFAKVISMAFKLKVTEIAKDQIDEMKSCFDDLKVSRWSYPYVEASKMYIWGNYSNGKTNFNPTNNITREDAIVALIMLLGLDDETVDLSVLNKFTDKEDITYSKRGFVAIAIKNGIINGDGNKVNPKKEMTRAEASYLIYSIINQLNKSSNSKLSINILNNSSLGIKTKIFNDGFISFEYPIEFNGTITQGKISNTEMKDYVFTYDKYFISIFYSTDPTKNTYIDGRGIGTNGLPELLKYLNKSEYKTFEKNNINNTYILMNYKTEYGFKQYIFGRGIDKYIPQVIVSAKNKLDANGNLSVKLEDDVFNESKKIDQFVNIIRNSFRVNSNIKSFASPGVDKNIMETYPLNNAINVERDVICVIKCNAQIGWGSKYIFLDELGNEIKDIDIYYSTYQNTLKIKFGEDLKPNTTYILKPEILNDIDGNFIEGGEIRFTTIGDLTSNNNKFSDIDSKENN